MMNPAALMKLMQAKNTFTENHPKFAAFVQRILTEGVTEGTVIEVTIQKPGEAPMTSNLRVQQSDLELLNSLKNLK